MSKRTCLVGLAFAMSIVEGAAAGYAQGAPPEVTYTVTGSANNWTLDFTLKSNFVATEGVLYFFGVKLPARDITGSPVGWDPNANDSWNNSSVGGSTTEYDNIWITQPISGDAIPPGALLSDFRAHDTDLVAPDSVPWFAYGTAGTYTGGGFFSNPGNPGFEGVAESPPAATPEPGSSAFLFTGAATTGLFLLRRRKQ